MARYKVWISTNKVGSKCQDEIEIEDGASEQEIEQEAREAAFQYLDWGYERIDI